MPDAYYDDEYLASLYDVVERHDGPDERFYLDLARSAGRVLDVGCGTGWMLHRAREAGHAGRLVGLDPAPGMLARARRHADIEWVGGYLPDVAAGGALDAAFDLVYMTGHAFQVLLDDDAVRELLAAVRRVLVPGGHWAFETRNPHARAWESWTPERGTEVVDPDGRPVRVQHEVQAVEGELVTFAETFGSPGGQQEPRVSVSTLRFMPAEHLDHLLTGCGFAVDERYGDWDRSPFTHASREIITVASAR